MYDNCHAWHFLILGDSGLVKEMPSGRRGCLCTAVGPPGACSLRACQPQRGCKR